MYQDPVIERFCKHIEKKAHDNGARLLLSPESHIPYPSTGDLVNGYMVEFPTKELAVATGKPIKTWLPILVHESSHLDQCIEKAISWRNSYVPNTTIGTIDLISLWIDDKIQLNEEQLDEYIRCSRNVEADCERRSVEKIKRFGLPIDITEYIQKANSYIFFYSAMKEIRSWYIPGKEPYNVKEIWTLCPTTFLTDEEYEHVPSKLMEAYKITLD